MTLPIYCPSSPAYRPALNWRRADSVRDPDAALYTIGAAPQRLGATVHPAAGKASGWYKKTAVANQNQIRVINGLYRFPASPERLALT